MTPWDDACLNTFEWVCFMENNETFDRTRKFVEKPLYYAIILSDGLMIYNTQDYTDCIIDLPECEQ